MTITTIPLAGPEAADPLISGTKGAGLAALHAASFDVPDAVILPVGIREVWPGGPPSEDLRAAVQSACEQLGDRLAVRSSATWEDGTSRAYAGVTATVLDVGGVDAVLDAIRHCLDASTAAEAEHGAQGGLAIVLQRLVPADWAGVAFTADPLSGDRAVVRIAATPGLGEALVQGEVVGDDIIVRGDTIEGGAGELAHEHVLAIAKTARQIEAHHGRPQDIEWAIADGRLHILQARPITVLPVEPMYPKGNNWQKDVAHYPEPVTPFGWSVLQNGADATRQVFDEMGLLVRGLEETSAGGQIYGRVLPAFGSADSASAPPPALVMGILSRLLPPLRRRTAIARRAVDTAQTQRWLDEWHRTGRSEALQRNAELWAVDLPALGDAELSAHADTLLENSSTGILTHFRLVMPLARALYRLHQFVERELGWDDSTMMSVFAGESPATRAGHEALAEIRRDLETHAGAIDSLAADPHEPLTVLRWLDPNIAARVESWIDTHGWAMVNYDAGVPGLAERPLMLSQLLLSDHSSTVEVAADTPDALVDHAQATLSPGRRAEFDELLAQARAAYPVREDNTIIVGDRPMALLRRWMLEVASRLATRHAIDSVQDGAYLSVKELRSGLTGAGDGFHELVRRRRGEEAWVRANPGPRYIGEQGRPPDISLLPAPLREVNEPVLWMIAHEYPTPPEATDDESVLIAGVAAAAGVAEGIVRVIRSHTDLHSLRPGEVLVCQVTSPAWAPLFPLAAAVVADGGGVLSHAAIAAREHGIPAVLGTASATATLVDGQRVRVDGGRGLVYAVD